ncbi:MAG: acetyl-CoA decarbonylase/synthase complex subunit delta [Lachnospiraceae bacterium]|nr:acetyl-CoA decarbonylase/synthase complex subunit delta [Lachnospiraceae bacterium]
MALAKTSQKFNSSISAFTIGTGDKTVTLGGENVLPFYSFDAPIENAPKIGVEISDLGMENNVPGIRDYYAGCGNFTELAAKASEIPGIDFIAFSLDAADPNGLDRSVEECVEECRQVAEGTDLPLVIIGCKGLEKNEALFDKVAGALTGRNVLLMSAKEENYKTIAASAGLAYGQKIGAESAVDINLAKQLNVVISQMGIKPANIAMNVGSAAAGYGFEYVVSTMERVKMAALGQNDNMLQMPIVTPVASESWNVKESLVSEDDIPEWGPMEERGIDMEIVTAAACLASGSNAVILRHPASIAAISEMIHALV